MESICSYLEADHCRCDALFAHLVACVARRSWEAADMAMEAFGRALRLHLKMEEDVIFAALEQRVRGEPAPLAALRHEHHLLRGLAQRLAEAAAERRVVDFAGHADAFGIVLHQHSTKEDSVMYPIADRLLRPRVGELIVAMEALRKAASADVARCELDVRGLDPMQQMERVLLTLGELDPGHALCALMDREPSPLYHLLDQNGFCHATHARSDSLYALRIWPGERLAPLP